MTDQEVTDMANSLRVQLMETTCCPEHGRHVLLVVLASFALDDADRNAPEAAASLRRDVERFAKDIETGRFYMSRTQ
jgi:hypothetical protein